MDEVLLRSGNLTTFFLHPSIPMNGHVNWLATVRDDRLADFLSVRASFEASDGSLHSLAGDIRLTDQGAWNGSQWLFSHQEDLVNGTEYGVLEYDVIKVTAVEQKRTTHLAFVPVEFNLTISEQGTKIEGQLTLHPNIPTLFTNGRDSQLEQVLTVRGPIRANSCTVLHSDGPRVVGIGTPENVSATSHSLCTARFLGP